MEVAVAGWVGSTNLGDELVFRALAGKLRDRDVSVTAVSLDPPATRTTHRVLATAPGDLSGSRDLLRRARGVLFGGGGLVQDETSPFNLPYHLSRVWIAQLAGLPWAGIGLGVGPLRTAAGRTLAASLRRAVAVSVRDRPSAALLAECGVTGVTVAADLAVSLPPPAVEVTDHVAVSLRPWRGGGGVLPVSWRRRLRGAGRNDLGVPAGFVGAAARALDDVARSTGLGIRFVAFQADRDGRLHRAVADRMRTPAECVAPHLSSVLEEIASCKTVVAMRYHAAIAAVLAGRPAVLLGYSPKVSALAGDVGDAGRLLGWRPRDLEALPGAVEDVASHGPRMMAARDMLKERERGNDRVIDRLLEAATRRRR